MPATKPIILPETFSGDTSWDEWVIHFHNCSDVNEWNDADKLKFLKVRLTGRAQIAFQRLADDKKDTFEHACAALQERFKPSSKRDLYVAELSSRKKHSSEGWADFAEELRRLAAKAYPNLDGNAGEQIALTHYLLGIPEAHVALAVRQKVPKTLEEAVSYTIQIESFFITSRVGSLDISARNCSHCCSARSTAPY